jgi:hypothetical protein
VPVALVAGGAVTAPLVIPILPVERLLAYADALGFEPPKLEQKEYNALPQHLADQFGWHGMVEAIARVYAALPDEQRTRASIYVQNYGEAGAIDRFGPAHHLPPASSGHNNYYLWGPQGEGAVVIVLGGRREDVERRCASVEEAGRTPRHPQAMPYENDLPIYVCRSPRIRAIWPALKRYI